MNHKGTLCLETERLLLRPFRLEDAPAVFRNWSHDDLVTKHLKWPTHETLAVTERVLAEWLEAYAQPNYYHWAIVLKELGEPIGSISAMNPDEIVDKVQVGYCIGRNWWHQGLVPEAYRALIPFLFNEVGVRRIESRHDPKNPNSGRVMKKCGLTYEGTLREADWSNQGITDTCVYSLLRSEWVQAKLPPTV